MSSISKSPGVDALAVDAFIDTARQIPAQRNANARGRLIFALDATMSRQPTWDLATGLQARMFETAASMGGLDVQLMYFRGLSECRASPFVSGGAGLARFMQSIRVAGGYTQIRRVLTHARDETRRERVGALVFIGDAVEENPDVLCATAGELALLGVKAFVFQEGNGVRAAMVFKEIARLTGGAYAAFDASAPDRLSTLLAAAAAYAAGGTEGMRALARRNDSGDTARLLAQIR